MQDMKQTDIRRCLNGLLFYVYIDSLFTRISSLKVGYSLGITRSNINAYADDIVLIAPSTKSLEILVNEALSKAIRKELIFNHDKTKTMVFISFRRRSFVSAMKVYHISNNQIKGVSSIRYLGFLLTGSSSDSDTINYVKCKF